MSKEKYISVADFAERAGVSKQAIYQRLKKDLKDYARQDSGATTLDIKALELFREPENVSPVYSTLEAIGERLDTLSELLEGFKGIYSEDRKLEDEMRQYLVSCRNSLEILVDDFQALQSRQEAIESNLSAIKSLLDGESNPTIKALTGHLETLRGQLEAKDRQIEALTNSLHESHTLQLEQTNVKKAGLFKSFFGRG